MYLPAIGLINITIAFLIETVRPNNRYHSPYTGLSHIHPFSKESEWTTIQFIAHTKLKFLHTTTYIHFNFYHTHLFGLCMLIPRRIPAPTPLTAAVGFAGVTSLASPIICLTLTFRSYCSISLAIPYSTRSVWGDVKSLASVKHVKSTYFLTVQI